MKRFNRWAVLYAIIVAAVSFISCDDDLSNIGGSLVGDQIQITVDSTTHKVAARVVYDNSFDTRAQALMLGKLQAEHYGELSCEFVAQLMPTYKLNIPDSIGRERIDSLRIVMTTTRGDLTGDSLAPQRLSVYKLTEQLPTTISSSFNPAGKYDPTPLTSVSYTASKMAQTDSAFLRGTTLRLSAPLPREWGLQIYDAYKTNPEVFNWPQTFAQHFPGIYVKNIFGSGCVTRFNSLKFMLYYHRLALVNNIVNGENIAKEVHVADSVAVFATAPEVLTSNIIHYEPSQYVKDCVAAGKSVVTTPGGYVCEIDFPIKSLLEKYYSRDFNLSVVGNLVMQIPATSLENNLGLKVPPYMLMVKTSKLKEFFENNMVPDGKTSFWASYDSNKGCYRFSSMRQYFLDIINRDEELSDDDARFTLVPVNISLETYTDPYTYKSVTQILACSPYIGMPTLTLLDTDRVMVCLTFTNQVIE